MVDLAADTDTTGVLADWVLAIGVLEGWAPPVGAANAEAAKRQVPIAAPATIFAMVGVIFMVMLLGSGFVFLLLHPAGRPEIHTVRKIALWLPCGDG
jgi:hypothetical protein